jgi:DNA-binding transcriptional regulator YdaS (Cro superfamily)
MGLIASLVTKAQERSRLPSKAAVARELGVLPNRLAEWAAGSRPCPLSRVMDLARLAGMDPGRAVVAYRKELDRPD